MDKIILLIGCNGIGDTLCAIPTIKHLSKVYTKNIHVFTYQPEIFKNFPYITLTDNYDAGDNDFLIHTFRPDLFVHTRTDIRQLHAISSGFQLLPEEMNMEFYPDPYIPIENLPQNYIVIHPSKTWPSRTWEKERWQELVDKLNEKGIPIVIVGKDSSEHGTYHIQKPVFDIQIKNGLNLVNKIGLHQTWHILNKSSMVITMDSGILHLAGTTDTYIIQLGSSVQIKLRAPYRKDVQNYKYSYISGECQIFCASDMKKCVAHNGKHTIMPPVAFCLERGESIGNENDIDPNIYKCHPTVDQVYIEVMKNYIFKKEPLLSNAGKIIIK
jgi:ADP-heptose:LPS heptosyltransferase